VRKPGAKAGAVISHGSPNEKVDIIRKEAKSL